MERGRSVGWCTENTLDELPEDVDKSIMVDGLAVLREEVLEFVGS